LLSQVFSNLIGNALTHGRESSPIHVRLNGETADEVTITVQNAGEIPVDVLPTIFAPYRSGRPQQETGGLGLGLYITREIAQMHGGRVEVRSDAENGTVFEVTVPREAVARRASSNSGETAQPFRLD
jgi:signal transduction histidine kinase